MNKSTLLTLLVLFPMLLCAQLKKAQTELEGLNACFLSYYQEQALALYPELDSETLPDSVMLLQKDSLYFLAATWPYQGQNIDIHVHAKLLNAHEKCKKTRWEFDFAENPRKRKKPISNPIWKYTRYYYEVDLNSGYEAKVKASNDRWYLLNQFGEFAPYSVKGKEYMRMHGFGTLFKFDNGQYQIVSQDFKRQSKRYYGISTTADRIDSERLSAIRCENGQTGMINAAFEEVIPCQYQSLSVMGTHFLIGIRSNKMVLIDHQTAEELTPLYDRLLCYNREEPYCIATIKTDSGKEEIKLNDRGQVVP